MLIDWFTVIAQLLNFLALVWLLKRFLYQPILNALDSRERKISAELMDAENKKLQAQAQYDDFLLKNQEFEKKYSALFAQVNHDAKIQRQRLLDEARQEADDLRLKQQQTLENEQRSLMTAISQRTQAEVLAIARQALQDLAGVSLENQIVLVFIEKLQRLNETEKQQMLLAVKNSTNALSINTAFELSVSQQTAIIAAVEKAFAIKTQLTFTTSAHLISGIELSGEGYKFSWSVADYLADLEKNLFSQFFKNAVE